MLNTFLEIYRLVDNCSVEGIKCRKGISKYECDYHFVSKCIYNKFIFTKEYLKLKHTTSNPPKKK